MDFYNQYDLDNLKLITKPLIKNNIKGYVLPHASTNFTGNIISHTMRFIPQNFFENIIILYFPANDRENVVISNTEKYYHEYYVPFKTIQYFNKNLWNYNDKKFIGINVREKDNRQTQQLIELYLKNLSNFEKSLIIVSADFSHFLDLQTAIEKENCATHAILHREIYNNLECLKHVDIIDSFKLLYKVIPSNWYLQWIGRTRSPGEKGVGYLSFLIKQPQAKIKNPDGIFVTVYDEKMHQRECLGEWFNNNYSVNLEQNLIDRVVNLAKTTSRLTNGNFLEIPITNYTVTYLYRDHKNIKFIRGYHSIKSNAFYLSDVLLENCFDDGIWITQEHVNWPQDYKFKLSNTLKQLKKKAQNFTRKTINRNKNTIKNTIKNKNLKNLKKSNPYQLYYSDVYYGKITNK
jgi:hypothetical protein